MSASGRTPSEHVCNANKIVSRVDELVAEKIDFAIVASPAPLHVAHALPLIKNNIPVLIEKPVATNIYDVDALIEASKQYETPVAVGYCIRYLPSAQKMLHLLKNKKLGKLYNAFIEVGQYLPSWRPSKNYMDSVSANAHLGGGALFELSHELDYSRWMLGEFDVKAAILRSSDILKLDVEDSVDVLAVSEQGVVANFHMDFLQRKAYRRCRFIGSEGALEWDAINNSITLTTEGGTQYLYNEPEWDKNGMYLDMISDFVSLAEGKINQCIPLEDAKKTVSLIEDIKSKYVSGC